ncbi:unnamed protein product [Urochloa decumbens]|uniref:PRISE-like Rossmann-fold domain-containing protein n=1 Tax=Urochloa decumbens TaxID=240449 RepID=A0ABC8YSZ0_9POAL
MGRRRWWPGAFDSSKRRREERAAAEAPAFAHVALVVGSTDDVGAALLDVLLGPDAPAGPWKVYALSQRALLPSSASAEASSSSNRSTVIRLHVDLADSAAVAQVLAPLTDITHVFYTGWTPFPGSTEAEAREANCGMLRKVLSAVVPNCPALAHVCLQTGRRPLMGVHAAARPQREDLPRLDYPHLEDALLDELADSDGAAITWSVHRPSTIFGLSPRSTRNVAAGLCAYAAICGEEGVTLRWPGSREAWEGVIDPSDAELVAEHALWAALDPDGKTNAFNSTKGNVFKWKELCPMLAMHFQLEWSGYDGESKRFKLVEAMAGKEDVWAQIVEEKKLAGTGLDNITTWWLVDAVINIDKEHLSTMTKDKDHGLFGFWNVVRFFWNIVISVMPSEVCFISF